jgi:hypothetical protein
MRLPTRLLTAAIFAASFLHAAPRPNVLFMMADDLNNSLGCYGHPLVKSPNLDKLAARGVRFPERRLPVPALRPQPELDAHRPLPEQHWHHLTNSQLFRQTIPNHISLPQAFRRDGYFAARIGKLYHYGVPNSIGTNGHDDPASWEMELNPAGCDRLFEHPDIFSLVPGNLRRHAELVRLPPAGRAAHRRPPGARTPSGFWNAARRTKIARSSSPSASSARTRRIRLAREVVQRLPRGRDARRSGRRWKTSGRRPRPRPRLATRRSRTKLTDDLRRQARAGLLCLQHQLHGRPGRQGARRARPPRPRPTTRSSSSPATTATTSVSTASGRNMSIFEESARVPLLIAGPGSEKRCRCQRSRRPDRPLPHTRRTLQPSKPLPISKARASSPILKDPATAKGRGWVLSQVVRGGGWQRKGQRVPKPPLATPAPRVFGYSLRTERWRYTEWDEGKAGKELYDHEIDPKELTNLADKPEHADTAGQARRTTPHRHQNHLPRPTARSPKIPAGNVDVHAAELVDP